MSKATKVFSSSGLVLAAVLVVVFFAGLRTEEQLAVPISDSATEPGPPAASTTRAASALSTAAEGVDLPVYHWKTFTSKDGLPSDKIFSLHADGDRVWIGTYEGLALYDNGKFRTYTVEDGLSHNFILSIEVDENTGDVWIGTGSGLTRYSAGKFEVFNQFNSGLANDFVYHVLVDGKNLWAATAAGVSHYDMHTGQWMIWNELNAPMHEPWTYSVTAEHGRIYVGAWGGGLIEYDYEKKHWKDYTDPDGEMEVDIFPDDGVVHDIISSVASDDDIVWVATYFGLSLFDGARWKGYFDHTSGLVSNFINYVDVKGPVGWLCTDRGLSTFDRVTWRTFLRKENGQGEIVVSDVDGKEIRRIQTPTAIAHNYVQSVAFQNEKVWVGTEGGLSVGEPTPQLASR